MGVEIYYLEGSVEDFVPHRMVSISEMGGSLGVLIKVPNCLITVNSPMRDSKPRHSPIRDHSEINWPWKGTRHQQNTDRSINSRLSW